MNFQSRCLVMIFVLLTLLTTGVASEVRLGLGENTTNPLDKYLIPAAISKMDWLGLRAHELYQSEINGITQGLHILTLGFPSYEGGKLKVVGYIHNVEVFNAWSNVGKKTMLLTVFQTVEKDLKVFFPELEETTDLLYIEIGLAGAGVTIAEYKNGQLVPKW